MTFTLFDLKRPWDLSFQRDIRQMFNEKKRVIDIGGSLRIDGDKNNRLNTERAAWLTPLTKKVEYLILDKVPDYHPDIVGDIHKLPFPDASEEAIICMAVLEHVENPLLAMDELYRVLKPGGYLFIYVPFLYYYHAAPGYYGDFWRFTKDTLALYGRRFSKCEITPVRGALETWVRLSPLGRWRFFQDAAFIADRLTGKLKSDQVSGYNIFLTK
jgi:SAM-dependent methyltransferase